MPGDAILPSPYGLHREANDGVPETLATSPPTAVFLLEQLLGHITHGKNLERLVSDIPEIRPIFVPIDGYLEGRLRNVPGLNNWTVRSGARTRHELRRIVNELGRTPDAMFVHTQVPAVLAGRWLRRIPSVVSLDATPKQYDALGATYAHEVGGRAAESVKGMLHRRAFDRARQLVTWSQWAKDGLVTDYGVDPAKVSVISPGVDLDLWTVGRPPHVGDPLRVLFVGGDFARKGGDTVLRAAARLRAEGGTPPFEIHLVTGPNSAEPGDGVVVHSGLTPNSAQLVDLYHRSDIFCLPTRADTFGVVFAEAGATGLPLVGTTVGAVPELVREGETGLVVPPGDVDALSVALRSLICDEELRRRLGVGARTLITQSHDAQRNARRIVDLLRGVAGAPSIDPVSE